MTKPLSRRTSEAGAFFIRSAPRKVLFSLDW
nr:MAG TPA: hypothetical protein [Caudoviricetes sp.]